MKLLADEMAEMIEKQAEAFVAKQAARDAAVLALRQAVESCGNDRKIALALIVMHLSAAGAELEDLYVPDDLAGKILELFPGRPIGSRWVQFSVGSHELEWHTLASLALNRVTPGIIEAINELASLEADKKERKN